MLVPIIQEDPFEQLTPREREVAELVQTGMKNLEISVKLNITETTLRVHLRRIYRKLGIQGRSNLRDFNSLALAERLPFPFLPESSIEDTKKRFRIGLARPRNRF